MAGMRNHEENNKLISELRELAEDLAVKAAQRVERQRQAYGATLATTVRTKSSEVDPVTAVDAASEEFIVSELQRLRPDDGVVAEEGHSFISTSGVTWIIDPIDGTVNFLYGIPHYAVSIAASYESEIVAGTVVNCATGVCYSAGRGQGSAIKHRDKVESLQCSKATSLSQALVATGFSYVASRRKSQAELLAGVLPKVRDIRRQGSAALDLCSLAAGTVDAYYEHALNAWDYAAGALIAREAGAEVSIPALDISGSEGEAVLASAPGIAEEYRHLAAEVGLNQSLPVES